MNIEEEFIKYVESFTEDECIYKKEHTFRVVNFGIMLGKNLNLDNYRLYLVKLCCLLHDIGRFEQFRKYHTFSDRLSKYHGDIGVEVLLKDNLIDKFCSNEMEKNLVLKTCKYHGTVNIPDDLNDLERMIINIVRDSDKIDILNNALLGNINLNIESDKVSRKVRECFYNHKLIDNRIKESKADNFVVWLAFVYDFNYSYTYKYLKNTKLMDKLILKYIDKAENNTTKLDYRKMCEELNKYIVKKIR